MLKIRQPRNAYDLLGLPWSATPVQVRARYRQLVRSHQRDLAAPDLLKDERFRQWTNSFLLLTSADRRDYDRRLRESRGTEQPPDIIAGLSRPRLLLIEAEVAYARRRLNEAAELAREALKEEKRNADGYALLGDILREQGKYQEASTMYNYAIQFDPNNRRFWQRFQEIQALRDGRALPKRYTRERPSPMNRPISSWTGVGLAVLLVTVIVFHLWDQQRWGAVAMLNLPLNFIYAALAAGFIMGLVLAATALLGPFDDELVWYQVTGLGTETTPLGLLVAIPGIVFFWLAIVFYAVIAWLDEHLSPSLVIAFAVCTLVTIAFGMLVPEDSRLAVRLIGGNFVFGGFLCGWLFGSLRRRVFEH